MENDTLSISLSLTTYWVGVYLRASNDWRLNDPRLITVALAHKHELLLMAF